MVYEIGPYAKLYYGVAGTTACSEMRNCTDVMLKLEAGDSDITIRPFVERIVTEVSLKDVSLSFDMVWDTYDKGFKAVSDAYFNNEAIALFASNGDWNGLDADFVVTSFSRPEPLGDAMATTVSVICKLTSIIREPSCQRAGGS